MNGSKRCCFPTLQQICTFYVTAGDLGQGLVTPELAGSWRKMSICAKHWQQEHCSPPRVLLPPQAVSILGHGAPSPQFPSCNCSPKLGAAIPTPSCAQSTARLDGAELGLGRPPSTDSRGGRRKIVPGACTLQTREGVSMHPSPRPAQPSQPWVTDWGGHRAGQDLWHPGDIREGTVREQRLVGLGQKSQ